VQIKKYWDGMNRLLLDVVELDLEDLTVYIDVYDSSLGRKWLRALNELINNQYHLEKNYCFLGFPNSRRNTQYLCDQINQSILAINSANLGYHIDDYYSSDNTIDSDQRLIKTKFNLLHRYFEDLQGHAGAISPYYTKADPQIKWHIRQLNLLCHEYESLVLSLRKQITAPEWTRPSQLMCWLNSPRFELDDEDYELFGIDTINRDLGGVYVGVNKAVGKHHYEVFCDEGRDSRINELTTSALRAQTLATGDFDIEWANNPGGFPFQIKQLKEFREWLTNNGFDPDDKKLTIGHPQVGQVNLLRSFGTADYRDIWNQLDSRLNVTAIRTSDAQAEYPYNWDQPDYANLQIKLLK
jgi:hypothetical protein